MVIKRENWAIVPHGFSDVPQHNKYAHNLKQSGKAIEVQYGQQIEQIVSRKLQYARSSKL